MHKEEKGGGLWVRFATEIRGREEKGIHYLTYDAAALRICEPRAKTSFPSPLTVALLSLLTTSHGCANVAADCALWLCLSCSHRLCLSYLRFMSTFPELFTPRVDAASCSCLG